MLIGLLKFQFLYQFLFYIFLEIFSIHFDFQISSYRVFIMYLFSWVCTDQEKYYRLGGINSSHCLTAMEVGKSKVKVPADWVLGESRLPDS